MESNVLVEAPPAKYIDPDFNRCSYCGFNIPKGVTYCWRCGKQLSNEILSNENND